ncbi:SPX domain-containing membrane protein [Symbiodinium microadriaticum]|uniref:SPX domain-containing membrane protein n=1 Tax=Symbiodinium microadriaticum TaxID=2951 RepID=A0A1Q9F3H0_SYMMI|nr:SPX domain-containing membrane protein [Symbiodinium microadriaticum]CAE6973544.1 unnamed protein product [Symbiodinium sp. KB8]CAE7176616.1 unnamed protein product [Symbiodinium microadriaticum]
MSVTFTETLPGQRGALDSRSPLPERIGRRSRTFGLDVFDSSSGGLSLSGASGVSPGRHLLEERMAPLPSLCLVMYSGFLATLALDIVVTTADEYSKKLGAGAMFSGLIMALTPLLQGLVGVPLNRWMLKSTSMKTVSILMAAGMVVGNIIYALAGLMHSKQAVLFARALIGICQFQLGPPIYIADAVGVKWRTPVMFVYSAVASLGLAAAPAICGLLDTFLHELRIHNLVLDSDTAPGWFMAIVYFSYLLKVVFFFENPEESPSQEASRASAESPVEKRESLWTTGFLLCLLAGFASTMTNIGCMVYFTQLSQHTWHWTLALSSWGLAGLMAVVCLLSLGSSRLVKLVEDRKGLQLSSLSTAIVSILAFQFMPSWSAATIALTFAGLLLILTASSVVKNYAYALTPKIVAPDLKELAASWLMLALTLGRGVGAQVGVLFTPVSFAVTMLSTYVLLFALVSIFRSRMKQHAKAV